MRVPKTPMLLGAGLLSAGLLGLTGTGTLSTVMAQVVTSPNTASLGRMVLDLRTDQKGDPGCSSAGSLNDVFTCTTVQPFGGRDDLMPGEQSSTAITVVNSGSLDPSGFTLAPDDCAPTGSPTDERSKKAFTSICKQMRVQVAVDGKQLFDGVAAELGGRTIELPPPAHGDSEQVLFTTSTSPDLGNDFQGLGVSVPMTWTFQQ